MKKASSSKGASRLSAAVLLAAALSAQAASLEIHDYRAQQRLLCVDVAERQFALSFIHSVSLTPVYDQYRLLPSEHGSYRIVQTEERFIAHGQGLPSMQGEPDAIEFKQHDGQFILRLQRPISDLIVRTDSRYRNRLHTGRTTINLNQWPDSGLWLKPVAHCEPKS